MPQSEADGPPQGQIPSSKPRPAQVAELARGSGMLSRIYGILQSGILVLRQSRGKVAYLENAGSKRGKSPFRKGSIIDRKAA